MGRSGSRATWRNGWGLCERVWGHGCRTEKLEGGSRGAPLGPRGLPFFCYVSPFGQVGACSGPYGDCVQLSSGNHHAVTPSPQRPSETAPVPQLPEGTGDPGPASPLITVMGLGRCMVQARSTNISLGPLLQVTGRRLFLFPEVATLANLSLGPWGTSFHHVWRACPQTKRKERKTATEQRERKGCASDITGQACGPSQTRGRDLSGTGFRGQ